MKRGSLLFLVLVLGIFLIACAPTPKVMEEPIVIELPEEISETAPAESVANEKPTLGEKVASAEHQITITADGFSPKTITVKAGDTVTFFNEDSNQHWPASAMHPTHNVYPESGGCIGSKFDACKGLEQGESFSFTFNEKGSWKYHDHLSVSSTGTVVVE
ncbi:MAG: cupredoxin domain-containing protein [Nanoarchaeota archaeon]|nr:cupredoxin domain-containing protein [Nanoarchaeota archaeon]